MSKTDDTVETMLASLTLDSAARIKCMEPDSELEGAYKALIEVPLPPFRSVRFTAEFLQDLRGRRCAGDSCEPRVPVTMIEHDGHLKFLFVEYFGGMFARPAMEWEHQMRAVAPELYESLITRHIREVINSFTASSGEGVN